MDQAGAQHDVRVVSLNLQQCIQSKRPGVACCACATRLPTSRRGLACTWQLVDQLWREKICCKSHVGNSQTPRERKRYDAVGIRGAPLVGMGDSHPLGPAGRDGAQRPTADWCPQVVAHSVSPWPLNISSQVVYLSTFESVHKGTRQAKAAELDATSRAVRGP